MAGAATQLEKAAPMGAEPRSLSARAYTLWSRSRAHWAEMQPAQRRRSFAAFSLVAAVTIGIVWFGLRTDWRTLYAGLDPDEARQIGLTLTQAQIPFEVASNGTAILVPAPQLDKARLSTAGKGVKSGRLGFELFDKPNWVGSEFDEQVNYQRALEGELEHTVGTLADIESARVHLVLPRDSLFRDEMRPAKASVVLKLRNTVLADGEAESIRNLVASAVDGLSPDRVVLVDAAGHLPLGPKTTEGLRLNAEQALEEKLIATLEPATGAGNVRASVTLDYDEGASDETEETYDPDQSATLSMQRTEQTSGSQPIAAGVPGTASNAPNAQTLPVYPKLTTPPETSKSESGTYGVSKSVRHVVENPGRVRRMTAAIVVNDRLLRDATKRDPAQWEPWPPDQLRNLTLLAQAAVGFDAARGDVVTVEDLAFSDNRTLHPISTTGRLMETVERSPELIRYTAILAGLVVLLAWGVRPLLKLASTAGAGQTGNKIGTRELPGSPSKPLPNASEQQAPDPERLRTQEIFEQVTGHLKREPTQSSRLLQSWIHSE
jgi:flagellar M-ring protein FliF